MVKKAPHWKTKTVHRKILRHELASEQGGKCYYCRSFMGPDLTIEHVRARSNGGPDVKTNMKAACRHCNGTRGNMPHGEFWKAIRRKGHPPEQTSLWLVWMRRQLNLRTERAVKRIRRYVGMEMLGTE